MFTLLPLVLLIVGGAVVVLVAVRSRSSAAAPVVETRFRVDVATQVTRTRRRLALALGLYFVVGAALVLALPSEPLLGLGQALGVAVAAIVAALTLAASPVAVWPGSTGLRTAELTPRSGGSFGPRWGFALPLASAGILILFLLVTGLSSTTDDFGLYRAFTVEHGTGSSTGSPYPGWYYGVPVILATIVLALAVLLVLHRIAAAPRPASPELFDVDDALRRSVTRFVMLLSSSALLAYFAGVAVIAGMVTSSTATQWTTSPDWQIGAGGVGLGGDYLPTYLQPIYAVGIAEVVGGLVLFALAIVLLVAAVVTAALRWAPAVVAEPEFESGMVHA